jgi:DNA-binding transcriptional ArsR family regulator
VIGPFHRMNSDAGHARPPAVFPPAGERVPSQLSMAAGRQGGGGVGGDGSVRRGGGGSGSGGPRQPLGFPAPSTELCRLLSLLADKTRLRILNILADGERPVVSLTAELGLPQPTVSHHLAWLRMMDLVVPRRQGKNVFYALGRAVRVDPDRTMTLTAADSTVTIRQKLNGE